MSCSSPSSSSASSLKVSCAIIEAKGLVLAARRGPGMAMPGKWEFPGGKIRPGESPRGCIVREIREELGLEVEPRTALRVCEHSYPSFRISLHPFVCRLLAGEISLAEHQEARWISACRLQDLDLADADRMVLTAYLRHLEQRRDAGA